MWKLISTDMSSVCLSSKNSIFGLNYRKFLQKFDWDSKKWIRLKGKFEEISISEFGDLYGRLGCNVFHIHPATYTATSIFGKMNSICVDRIGNLWGIHKNKVFLRKKNHLKWIDLTSRFPERVKRISVWNPSVLSFVSTDNEIFVSGLKLPKPKLKKMKVKKKKKIKWVTCKNPRRVLAVGKEGKLYEWNVKKNKFKKSEIGGKKWKSVHTSYDGTAIGLTISGQLFQLLSDKVIAISNARFQSFSVGNKRLGYGIGRTGKIWRWSGGKEWEYVPGKAVQVAVNRHGHCYVLDKRNLIYRYTGQGWVQFPGFCDFLEVADDGQVWGIYKKQVFVYKRNWTNVTRQIQKYKKKDEQKKKEKEKLVELKMISVTNKKTLWGVSKKKKVYKRKKRKSENLKKKKKKMEKKKGSSSSSSSSFQEEEEVEGEDEINYNNNDGSGEPSTSTNPVKAYRVFIPKNGTWKLNKMPMIVSKKVPCKNIMKFKKKKGPMKLVDRFSLPLCIEIEIDSDHNPKEKQEKTKKLKKKKEEEKKKNTGSSFSGIFGKKKGLASRVVEMKEELEKEHDEDQDVIIPSGFKPRNIDVEIDDTTQEEARVDERNAIDEFTDDPNFADRIFEALEDNPMKPRNLHVVVDDDDDDNSNNNEDEEDEEMFVDDPERADEMFDKMFKRSMKPTNIDLEAETKTKRKSKNLETQVVFQIKEVGDDYQKEDDEPETNLIDEDDDFMDEFGDENYSYISSSDMEEEGEEQIIEGDDSVFDL